MNFLTTLDNDFITYSARVMLDGENMDRSLIEKLAELGQKEAMAEYYLLFSEPYNYIIEKNYNVFANLEAKTCRELKIRISRDCKYTKKEFETFSKKYINAYVSSCNTAPVGRFPARNGYEDFCNERDNLAKIICNNNYFKAINAMIEVLKDRSDKLNNPIAMTDAAYYMSILEDVTDYDYKTYYKKSRKLLLREYKKDPNNIEIAYTLAKNLTFYKSSNSGKELAKKILTKLASREYSDELKAYITPTRAEDRICLNNGEQVLKNAVVELVNAKQNTTER